MDITLLLACLAAFGAGFIDAIVGGGGLLQAPAMLILYPHMTTQAVIGTNRLSSFMGTLMAGYQYARKITMPWRVVFAAGIGSAVCAYIGAQYASLLPEASLKGILFAMMFLLACYTFLNKGLGQHDEDTAETPSIWAKSLLLGMGIGFYNGFVGPGTGTLLVFGFVLWLRFSFLRGSGISKFVNVIADVSSLSYFLVHGLVMFEIALPMLVCNVAGSYLGSRMAILRGNTFIRKIFIVVVSALLCRFGYDLYFLYFGTR